MPFGKLKNLKFFEDKVNGKSKGYALVEYTNPDSAREAKDKLQGRFCFCILFAVNVMQRTVWKALHHQLCFTSESKANITNCNFSTETGPQRRRQTFLQ